MCSTDGHFILQGILKMIIPTQGILNKIPMGH